MNAAFRAASNPRPFTVLGLRLHSLCIGHWFLMEQHGCDVVRHESSHSLNDLLLSVFICSQPPSESAKDLARRLKLWLFLRIWSFVARRFIWILEAKRFQAYIRYHRAFPSVSIESCGREMGTPEHWRLLTMLMFECGSTRAEALATPWLFANCLWAVEGERKNAFSVVSDQACEAMSDLGSGEKK